MLVGTSLAVAAPVVFQAKSGKGLALKPAPVQANAKSSHAWSCDEKSGALTFTSVDRVLISADGILYLGVAYLDEGYGRLNVQLIPDGGNPVKPDRFLGCQRTNSGKVVSALMRMGGIPVPRGAETGRFVSSQ